ncbi:(2Fe-2S)-binding protein [Sulfurimonas sp. NW15]|uniref:hypothetical protein n=1 Tax=unclassified Sulfurimonas TaxID=2623549 RepID=UPI003DA868C8
MLDLDTEICVCNSLTLKDIADCIKENNFTTLQELLQNDICPMGDKCESCRDEGYHNDGLNLPMVLAMVKRKQI